MIQFTTIEDYTEHLRSVGRWSFTWEELKNNFSQKEKALKQSLFRLKAKGKIVTIRSGFYIIIPVEYARLKMIPADLFIDDLMNALGKKYYVALFTAAGFHGASHQAVMDYYVMTDQPAVRQIKNQNVSIHFFVKKHWPGQCIIKRKTDAGYINVSSPELTLLDLLEYGNFSINKIATILDELRDELNVNKLKKLLSETQTSTIQRLGFLMDKVLTQSTFSMVLYDELRKRNIYPVPLAKGAPKKGSVHSLWKVIGNTQIASEL